MWTAKKTAMPDTYWILDESGGMVAKVESGRTIAALVVTAPEMLVALKLALGAISVECRATRELVERAIAKAEGRE